MSRNSLVYQLIIVLFNVVWFISCDLSVNSTTNVNDLKQDQLSNDVNNNNDSNTPNITKRSDNVIISSNKDLFLDGIRYLPDCGILCRLHKFTTHLPPFMINFNHQYHHFMPMEPIDIAHSEVHPDIHEPQPDLFHTAQLHPDIHELHHPELHHPQIHHPGLHQSDLHLSLHSKFLPNFGLDHHHHHLAMNHFGLGSTNVQQTTLPIHQSSNQLINPIPINQISPNQQLQTSASNLANNNEDAKLEAIQRMFAHYEVKYPVSILEENFPLPIESHSSSLRPLFVPDKNELHQSIPPYELEDSRSNFIDYQPFHPSHYSHSPPPFDHHPPPYFDKKFTDGSYVQKKPNIEILKLNEEHDYPLPPPNKHAHPNDRPTHYDHLMADVHSRIKDPATYYHHPEQKGSIVYADSEFDKKPVTSKVFVGRPETSKIDENGVLTIGQNYAKVKNIHEQLNSLKRQYPTTDLNHSGEQPNSYDNPIRYDDYRPMNHHIEEHHMNHHHHIQNSHFGGDFVNHEMPHFHQPPHYMPQDHYKPPVIIEDSPPIHIQHHQNSIHFQQPHFQFPTQMNHPNHQYPIPNQQAKQQPSRPSMEFNGFYSNFYSNLPPAKPPSLIPYKK